MTASYRPIEIIIADDHPLMRKSLKIVISETPGFKLVGEATNGYELVELSKKIKPDIIITDIKMPVMDGIEAAKQLSGELPGIGIIALSIVDEEDLIVDMLEAGAKGYLLKDIFADELVNAVNAVYKGQTFFSKEISNNITRMVGKGDFNSYKNNKLKFSEKELDIIKLICHEKSNKQIADLLNITKKAVDNLRMRILKKADAKNTAGIVMYAVKNKIY